MTKMYVIKICNVPMILFFIIFVDFTNSLGLIRNANYQQPHGNNSTTQLTSKEFFFVVESIK